MAWDECRSRCKLNKNRKRRLGPETHAAMKRAHSGRGSDDDVRETLRGLNGKLTQLSRKLNNLSALYPFRESLCGLLAADPSTLHVTPCDLDGVAIKTQLGTGRTSSVYKGDWHGQEVAVKCYRKEFKFALKHEVEMLTRLQGIPGIPTLVETNDAQRYLLMSPIGESLESYERWAYVFAQLVEILRSVHENGIIHRDIRPANILLVKEELDTEPHVVLIDWGFAAIAGKKEIFSGTIETGSDNLFEQLLQAQNSSNEWNSSESNLFHSECTSVGGDGASGSEGLLTRGKAKLVEMSDGGDGASGGVLTRGKAKLAEMSVGGDGASESEGVLTRDKAKLAETKKLSVTKGVSCSLGPEDDLVSLVRAFLLLTHKSVKEQVKSIARDDYGSYLSSWRSIMADRPRWNEVQDSALQRDYQGVMEFLNAAATFMN